jgi:hypothetical protein
MTLLPLAAGAEERLMIVAAPELPHAEQSDALIIATGVLIGAAVGLLLPFRFATLAGGAVGGALSHLWYGRTVDDYRPLVRRNDH